MAVLGAGNPFRPTVRGGRLAHAGEAPVHGSDLPAPVTGHSPQLCMSRCAFDAAKKTLSVFT